MSRGFFKIKIDAIILLAMKSNYSLSAFFPAYNEEKNLKALIKKADQIFNQLFFNYEIIIINDGSRDNTLQILEELKGSFSKLKIISHKENLGYGAALKSGFLAAQKDLIFFSDADNQFDLGEIKLFLSEIENFDVIIGFRKNRQDNFIRRLNTWLWNNLINFLFKIRVSDVDCAFKLFRKEILEKIKPQNFQSQGAMISAEILVKLKKADAKIRELPISHFPRTAGKPSGVKLKVIIKAFKELFRFYFQFRK